MSRRMTRSMTVEPEDSNYKSRSPAPASTESVCMSDIDVLGDLRLSSLPTSSGSDVELVGPSVSVRKTRRSKKAVVKPVADAVLPRAARTRRARSVVNESVVEKTEPASKRRRKNAAPFTQLTTLPVAETVAAVVETPVAAVVEAPVAAVVETPVAAVVETPVALNPPVAAPRSMEALLQVPAANPFAALPAGHPYAGMSFDGFATLSREDYGVVFSQLLPLYFTHPTLFEKITNLRFR